MSANQAPRGEAISDPRRAAVRHLEELAKDLREGRHGLEVMVEPGNRPYPTLLIQVPGLTWARVVAGTTHFWWVYGQRKELIGPVDPKKRGDVTSSIVDRFNAVRQIKRNRRARQVQPR